MTKEGPSQEPETRQEAKTDVQRLAEVRKSVDTETRKKALEGNDPTAKMQLNLAWAKQYPEHPLALAIQGLEKYGDLKTDKKAAEQAIAQMVEIQKKIGITDSKGQDGIIGRGTLGMYEAKTKAKEVQEAEKLIAEFDGSFNVSRLNENTQKVQKEQGDKFSNGIQTAWKGGGELLKGNIKDGIKNIVSGLGSTGISYLSPTKVQDGAGKEYTVSKLPEGQNQYTAENGEVFELKDGKMSPVSKIDLAVQRGGEELDTIIDDELRNNFNFGEDLSPEFMKKMSQNPELQKKFLQAYNDFQKKVGNKEHIDTEFLSRVPEFGYSMQGEMKKMFTTMSQNTDSDGDGKNEYTGITDIQKMKNFTKLAIQTRKGFGDLPETVQKTLITEIDNQKTAEDLTNGKALTWVTNWPGISNPQDIKNALSKIPTIIGDNEDPLQTQLSLLASKGLNNEEKNKILASNSIDNAIALLDRTKKRA